MPDDRALRHLAVPRLVTAAACKGVGPVFRHVHELTEVVVIESGEVSIEVNGMTLRGNRGATLVLPAHVPHRQLASDQWRTLCLLFHPTPAMPWALVPRAIAPDPSESVLAWAEQLCSFFVEAHPSERMLDGLMCALLERLVLLDERSSAHVQFHPLVREALEVLAESLDERADIRAVARRLGCSYAYLGRVFRQQIGCGPLTHHINLRIERAAKLLLNPYSKVAEVGEACGFDDLNYFVRRFRQQFGVAPGTWRSTHLRQPDAPPSIADPDVDTPGFIESSVTVALQRSEPSAPALH